VGAGLLRLLLLLLRLLPSLLVRRCCRLCSLARQFLHECDTSVSHILKRLNVVFINKQRRAIAVMLLNGRGGGGGAGAVLSDVAGVSGLQELLLEEWNVC